MATHRFWCGRGRVDIVRLFEPGAGACRSADVSVTSDGRGHDGGSETSRGSGIAECCCASHRGFPERDPGCIACCRGISQRGCCHGAECCQRGSAYGHAYQSWRDG